MTKPYDTLNAEAYTQYMLTQAKKKAGQDGNKWVIEDRQAFHNQEERDRYVLLKYMVQNGEIQGFKRQHLFQIRINNILITTYRCCFVVTLNDGSKRVEDTKPVMKPDYPIKRALMKALYEVEIFEPYKKFTTKKAKVAAKRF